jgi:WD40 repeat protein/serine/threonine protein kinase
MADTNPDPVNETRAVGEAAVEQAGATVASGHPGPAAESVAEPARAGVEADVPAVWQPGDVILDLYEVQGVLGQGGMGTVYKVRHRGWNLDLAVKSPRPDLLTRRGAVEDFEREAETWVNLGLYPHTVTCFYVRRLGGIPRIFAEYVAGGSLADWIRQGRLYEGGRDAALERILDVAIGFAWGLHHAHEKGMIHQDVKPANVLMTADGTPKVTDFGLANALAGVGGPAAALSGQSILVSGGGMTPAYCSPEQAQIAAAREARVPREQWARLTRRTDLWSWAVSLLEVFTGSVTWPAGQVAAEALEGYLQEEAADEQRPAMPAGLANLLRQCFQADPAQRPRDMLEVVTGLREVYRQVTDSDYPLEAPHPAESLADGLNNWAVSLVDLGRQADAEKSWEQALQVDGLHHESRYNFGLVGWRGARLSDDEVLQQVREIAESHRGDWLPHYLEAEIHLERGDTRAAVKSLEKIDASQAGRDDVRALLQEARQRLPQSRGLLHHFDAADGCHSDWVLAVCLGADGRLALSGSADHTARLWDVNSRRCLRTFQGHTSAVMAVALSGDGRLAATGSFDRTVRLWQVDSGRVWAGEHGECVNAVSLSAAGDLALSASDDQLLAVIDVVHAQCLHVLEGHAAGVKCAHLSDDGRLALSGDAAGKLKLWDVAGGACLRTLEGHAGGVSAVCLGAGGRLALSGGEEGNVRLWDVPSGQCLRVFRGHTQSVKSVCLSADGRHALSAGHRELIKLWEVDSGRCLWSAEHNYGVTAVSMSPDGRLALSGGYSARALGAAAWETMLSLWSLALTAPKWAAPILVCRPQERAQPAQSAYRHYVDRARRGLAEGDASRPLSYLGIARSQTGCSRRGEGVALWLGLYRRLRRKKLVGGWEACTLRGHTAPVNAVALSLDGERALSGSADHTLKLWDLSARCCVRTFEGHTRAVQAVSLSADARLALSAGDDGTLRLWQVDTGQCLRTFAAHGEVETACLSEDGRWALSGGGSEKGLRLWEAATGRCLAHLGKEPPDAIGWVHWCGFSADNRLAMAATYECIYLWNLSAGRFRAGDLPTCRVLPEDPKRSVKSVCLSADGRLVLSGNEVGNLRIWDVSTSNRTWYSGANHPVTSLYLSADGRCVLQGMGDRTLILCDLASGRHLRTFRGHTGDVTSVGLSTDCRLALSGSRDGTLKVWVLDWQLEDRNPAAWDEEARPYLHTFLASHTPYALTLAEDREPTDEEISLALTRQGRPAWTQSDFQQLLVLLAGAGLGWLRPEGVRRELEKMAATWQGPPPPI